MATNIIQKPDANPVVYPLNHKRLSDIEITIQNNTSAAITIEVTADNVQREPSPTYNDPESGAISIPAGSLDVIREPYAAFRASGTGTGEIKVVEPY